MKEKFLTLGGECMYPHELLEMLLYYAKPQGDTNPCAHALLERFGSWKGIFDASADELMEVEGVGEHTASLLKLLPTIYKTYEQDMHSSTQPFDSISCIVKFCHPKFVSLLKERVYMLLLNNRMELIDCVLIAEGTVNRCELLLRLISEKVLAKHASYVVLAHNHPNGCAVASNQDVELTNTVLHHLLSLDAVLLEHIVFSETHFYPIIKNLFATDSASSSLAAQEARERVAQGFYDLNETVFSFPTHFQTEE